MSIDCHHCDHLQRKIDAFREASGVDIMTPWQHGDIAEAVSLVLAVEPHRIAGRMRGVADRLGTLSKAMHTQMDEIEAVSLESKQEEMF